VEDDRTDALYGLPLEEFTAARNALARELRQEGDRKRAEEVAGLRKPTRTAWAVNQVVRTQRRATDELLAAGEEVRHAQQRVLAGQASSNELTRATERERAAVQKLVDTARGLLTARGELSDDVLDRVAETLHAAALDDDTRRLVETGRLDRERRVADLGTMGGKGGAQRTRKGRRGSAAPAADRATEKAPARAAAKERLAGVRKQRQAVREELREARRARVDAARALRRARTGEDEAERRLAELEKKVEALRRAAG
jgi:hypothetical protein